MRAVGAGQHPPLAEAVHDVGRLLRGGLEARAVPHELDAEEEAGAPHVADDGVPLLQPPQACGEVPADPERPCREPLVLDHVEDGEAGGAGDGVAAERAEELHAVGEGRGDLARGHHGAEREAVPDRLAEDDHVRHDALPLEAPERLAEAAEARLHLVGDRDAAGRAHVTIRLRQVAGREDDLAGDARQGLREERGEAAPVGLEPVREGADVAGVLRPRLRVVPPVSAPVRVGQRSHVHPLLAPPPARPVELVGAHVHERRGVAVVGVLEHDHVLAAGPGAGEPQRQLVGLAARGDEVADPQGLGEEAGEPLGVAQDRVVQVPRVGVEEGQLLLRGADDARVGVAHERDVVVRVEVGAPGLVVEVLRPAAHDLERPAVRDREVAPEEAPSRGQRLRGGLFLGREAIRGDAQQEVGVGRQARPQLPLAGQGDPGKVRVPLEQVEDHLEVEVGRPVAVRGRRAHPRDGLARLDAPADREGGERVLGQVAVEGEERRAVARLVAEDRQRPVVLRCGVVREDVDDTRQGGADRRPRLDEEVDPEVDRPPLVCGPPRREGRRQVDPARLVVTPHADRDPRAPHRGEDPLGQGPGLDGRGVRAEEEAADAEVQDEAGRLPQVRVEDGPPLHPLEPRDDRRAVGDGREPAGRPERVVGEAGVDPVEPLERGPRRGLAHRDVGVAGGRARPHRGVRNTHRETRADEGEEERDLLRLEREGGVVAGDDRGRRGERVVLAQERVGRRDRRLRHEEAVVQVAEIEEARHLAGMGVGRADQDVVVVRVAVDDAAPQAGEGGHDLRLVAREHPL